MKYPIGVQNLEQLRNEGYVYFDKIADAALKQIDDWRVTE